MYTDTNYKTKKALREALARGEQVSVYQPGGIFESQCDGTCVVEGPHYPKPHSWYARVQIKDGYITKILS